jgi:hypothetical protein
LLSKRCHQREELQLKESNRRAFRKKRKSVLEVLLKLKDTQVQERNYNLLPTLPQLKEKSIV